MTKQNKIPSNNPDFFIRVAEKKDAATILGFIEELADYEKLRHEVRADVHMLEEQLFGACPAAEAVIGELSGEAVGFALFFQTFSTFLCQPGMYLEDLYVSPKHRGAGLGKILLSYLAKLSVERNYGRLEWAVLNWNEPAIQFYRSLDTEEQNEWTVHRLKDDSLRTLAAIY